MSNFKAVVIATAWETSPRTLYHHVRKWLTGKNQPFYGPKKGDVVIVTGEPHPGYYSLRGFNPIFWYNKRCFRPLDNLEEQIERIEEEGAPVELEPEYA